MTVSTYSKYLVATGEFIQTFQEDSADLSIHLLNYLGATDTSVAILLGLYDGPTQYVQVPATTVTTRPTLGSFSTTTITADGVSGATITGLPNPTIITVGFTSTEIASVGAITETSGSFTFKSTIAGTFTVTLNGFPYQLKTVTITAV